VQSPELAKPDHVVVLVQNFFDELRRRTRARRGASRGPLGQGAAIPTVTIRGLSTSRHDYDVTSVFVRVRSTIRLHFFDEQTLRELTPGRPPITM
jgi:hypothetical protein